MITKKDVELAGKLAKMSVSTEEADIYEGQLRALFGWVKDLAAVNTDEVKLTNVTLAAHTRKDQAITDLEAAAKLRAMFAQEMDGQAKVKKVL
ncbi:MAG: aspartyl/glutamyl-tRNA amidotransferase subunit C [Elusimicrobiaceae bacterium]|nr:aspartyl/glutamyl-tRNA amidotransferase subunit C [Elusimicrobiaceae bacterium]MBP5616364.1 aspartyl/glutamyl-tRNA amidotransferase subunit C [Elusimicrobiaceae bacterium]